MSETINISDFFKFRDIPVIDVRSPGEFCQGHIPGAINIPLFDNEERAVIGTLYKKSGEQEAILTGLEIAGKKMRYFSEIALKTAKNNQLIVHCWRGGMRSLSMSWLMEANGIHCKIIRGGYKSYRQYVHDFFGRQNNFFVIGGMTGSGKSEILDELEKNSLQVLKLEHLANHKGSAFGHLGQNEQNSTEQFENDIFNTLLNFDNRKPVFVEDESKGIGKNNLPPDLFNSMALSPLLVIDMDIELRANRLEQEYGSFPKQDLIESIWKIEKRLGGHNTRLAIKAIQEGRIKDAVRICLVHYDKTYSFGLNNKKSSETIAFTTITTDPVINAQSIIALLKNKEIIPIH